MNKLYREFMFLVNACNRAENNTTHFLKLLYSNQDCCVDTLINLKRAYSSALIEHSLAFTRLADFVIKYQSVLSFTDQVPIDTPVRCLYCCYFGDPDPINPDPDYARKYTCCWEPDEECSEKPCGMTLPDDLEE